MIMHTILEVEFRGVPVPIRFIFHNGPFLTGLSLHMKSFNHTKCQYVAWEMDIEEFIAQYALKITTFGKLTNL